MGPHVDLTKESDVNAETNNGTSVESHTERILQFFTHSHLRTDMQNVSKPFGDLALNIVNTLPRNPERTVALRKLLEAKDAAVRSLLAK